jgi:hypothetical protein
MKTLHHLKKFRIAFLLFLLFNIQPTLQSTAAAMPLKEFSKTISESFDISDGGLVEINNRYGNVNVETVPGNRVSFEVIIVAEAKSEERADEILDRVDIRFSSSSNKVSAVTDIGDGKKWKWKNNESFKINYRVMLPESSPVNISNKYGDVGMVSVTSDVELNLKYGNGNLQDIGGDLTLTVDYASSFSAGSVGGEADLALSYSQASFEDIETCHVQSKYSQVSFGDVANMDTKSMYDKYEINSVGQLISRGKYDHFKISKVGKIDMDTRFTNVKIGEMTDAGDFKTEYGSVLIESILSGFDHLDIQCKYTGYTISPSGGFRIDAEGSYTSFSVPDDMNISEKENEGKRNVLKGQYGNGASAITAVMKYGHLKVKD